MLSKTSLLTSIFTCHTCKKQYRIIPQELKFYQQQNLALPHQCFTCRHQERLSWKGKWQLWDRTCNKCQKPLRSAYAPEQPFTILCEKCYLESLT